MLYRARNKLAFPCGRAPGFDPGHGALANGECIFSGVIQGTPGPNQPTGAVNLITGASAGVPYYSYAQTGVDGLIGPYFFTSGGATTMAFTGPAVNSSSYTCAAITRIGSGANAWFFALSNNLGNAATAFGTAAGGAIVQAGSSNYTISGSVVAGGVYFIVISASTTTMNVVIVNLATGQRIATTHSVGYSFVASNGNYEVFSATGGGATHLQGGRVSAVMCSTGFLSLSQLLSWADDPWSFWYPDLELDFVGGARVNVALYGRMFSREVGQGRPLALASILGRGQIVGASRASPSGVISLSARGGQGKTMAAARSGMTGALELAARSVIGTSGRGVVSAVASLVSLTGRVAASINGRGLILTLHSLLTDPRFITRSRRRVKMTAAAPRFIITASRNFMPQGRDFSVIDAGEIVTGTFDFGPWLSSGVTIASILSTTCAVYQGTDASAATRLVGPAVIGPSPSSGAISAAVLQQWGNMVAGVCYRLDATVLTSDGQTFTLWAHQLCQQPA